LYKNWFIHFENIVLTSLVMDEQTDGEVGNNASAWQSGLVKA